MAEYVSSYTGPQIDKTIGLIHTDLNLTQAEKDLAIANLGLDVDVSGKMDKVPAAVSGDVATFDSTGLVQDSGTSLEEVDTVDLIEADVVDLVEADTFDIEEAEILEIDDVVTEDSTNLITSGAVYTAIQQGGGGGGTTVIWRIW